MSSDNRPLQRTSLQLRQVQPTYWNSWKTAETRWDTKSYNHQYWLSAYPCSINTLLCVCGAV